MSNNHNLFNTDSSSGEQEAQRTVPWYLKNRPSDGSFQGYNGSTNTATHLPNENYSPIGAYPDVSDSPIGNRPRSQSPLGAYPDGSDSAIGSRPRSQSPLGAYPDVSDSPIGNRPHSQSPLGAYPDGSDSPIGSGTSDGYDPYSYGSYPQYGNAEQTGQTSYYGSDNTGYTGNDSYSQNSYHSGYGNAYEENTFYQNETENIPPPAPSPDKDSQKLALPLFSVWTGLTIIATVILMCMGQIWSIIFELFHIIPLITLYIITAPKNKLRTAFICIGLSAAFIGLVSIMCISKPGVLAEISNNFAGNLILMLFAVTASLLIVIPKWTYNARRKRCSEKVLATICAVDTYSSRTGKRRYTKVYKPTFEYTFRGRKYTSSENVCTNSYRPVVGRRVEILIDPNQPDYITDISMRESSISMLRVFGYIFYGFYFFVFFIEFLNS